MPLLTLDRVTYRYPERRRAALRDFSLSVEAGELLLVIGESGSGKSTLLRAINGLVPHFYGGEFQGEVRVAGVDPLAVEPRDLAATVGFVFQEPEAQFVTEHVEDELVFAMENLGLPRALMAERLEEVVAALGLARLRHRAIATLSGGEKQRVAIASVLTLQPPLLVLDEPTSQLDPRSAAELLAALVRLNRERGLTVILAEHRLERVVKYADRLLLLSAGGEARVGPPREVLRESPLTPPLVELGRALGWAPLPLTVEEAKPHAAPLAIEPPAAAPPAAKRATEIDAWELSFTFPGGARPALRDVSFTVGRGEFVAVVGANGSGKSTLLKHLVGLLPSERGRIVVAGEELAGRPVQEIARTVGYVPQEPGSLLFAESVAEELAITLRNHGIAEEEAPIAPEALLARLGLADVAARYPRDLSAGQRERVALGAILVTHPRVLLLDEPTRGLDYAQKRALMALLRGWQKEGTTVLLVTHDVELVAEFAERVLLLDRGALVADGPTGEVLTANPAFAPQMLRLFGRADLLTAGDALARIRPTVEAGS